MKTPYCISLFLLVTVAFLLFIVPNLLAIAFTLLLEPFLKWFAYCVRHGYIHADASYQQIFCHG
ncbi:MAG: hypothetical protein RR034_08235 [Bacteroidales bacterium]